MRPSGPPRITLLPREPGAKKVMARRLQVGHVLQGWRGRSWTAYLWLAADDPDQGMADEVRGPDLRNLRDRLNARVAESGPWWKAPS